MKNIDLKFIICNFTEERFSYYLNSDSDFALSVLRCIYSKYGHIKPELMNEVDGVVFNLFYMQALSSPDFGYDYTDLNETITETVIETDTGIESLDTTVSDFVSNIIESNRFNLD